METSESREDTLDPAWPASSLLPACIPLLLALWEEGLGEETEGQRDNVADPSHPGSQRQGMESTPGLLGAQLVPCGRLMDSKKISSGMTASSR